MSRKSGRVFWIALVGLTGVAFLAEAPAEPGDDTRESVDGVDVYFRDADLMAVAEQDVAEYRDDGPGDSELLARSFDSAPPQIPHSVEDLLPIVADENQCLECHLPENAEDAEAVPIPGTHFRRPVILGTPGKAQLEADRAGGMRVIVAGYEDGDALVGTMYNCVQCHTPQAENVREPANLFEGKSRP